MSGPIKCFQTFHECSEQRQWEIYKSARDVAEIAERFIDHSLNTASTMPKEHEEAHIQGRMKLRQMLIREVERYRESKKGFPE